MLTAPLKGSILSILALTSLIYSCFSNAEPFAYITNSGTNTVSEIRTSDNTVTATVNVGSFPIGVSVSPDGTKVYVSNSGDNTLSVIRTSDNTVTATVSVGQFPVGVSVTPDGTRVYVANFDANTVSVIRTSDNTVTATVNVGSGPIAIGNFIANVPSPSPSPPPQPVPTLSEWAQFIMMLMMIGTVGWYTRRMFR